MTDRTTTNSHRARAEPDAAFLPTTAYAVLGLLSFGTELSGYELRQLALNTLRFFFWSPAQSQIYRELRRLEELGLVTSRAVAQTDRPDKVAYAITGPGRDELARWVDRAPVAPPVFKFESALRLFFGQSAEPQALVEVVAEHRTALERSLADLREVRAALPDDDPALALQRIVAGWGLRLYQSELDVLADVADELAALPAPHPDEAPAQTARRLAGAEGG